MKASSTLPSALLARTRTECTTPLRPLSDPTHLKQVSIHRIQAIVGITGPRHERQGRAGDGSIELVQRPHRGHQTTGRRAGQDRGVTRGRVGEGRGEAEMIDRGGTGEERQLEGNVAAGSGKPGVVAGNDKGAGSAVAGIGVEIHFEVLPAGRATAIGARPHAHGRHIECAAEVERVLGIDPLPVRRGPDGPPAFEPVVRVRVGPAVLKGGRRADHRHQVADAMGDQSAIADVVRARGKAAETAAGGIVGHDSVRKGFEFAKMEVGCPPCRS